MRQRHLSHKGRFAAGLFAKPALILAFIALITGTLLNNHARAAESKAANRVRILRFTHLDQSFEQALGAGRRHAGANATNPALRRNLMVVIEGPDKPLVLTLQDNQHLMSTLPNTGVTRLLSGQLEGQAASWVRLTRTSEGVSGLIWDGAEMYVVEPRQRVLDALASSAGQPASGTVMFKLSDTRVDLSADYCGADHGKPADANTGLAAYRALTSEISEEAAVTGLPTLRLEIQVLADAAFRARYASDQAARDALLVRLNNVDGIFSSQVGLEVQATDMQIYSSDPPALSDGTDAGSLLSELSVWRRDSALMSSFALTHLFTGRDLDDDMLGIAYIGGVCNSRYGVSLSEVRDRGAWIDSLVAAHELGHQLGAVHDGTEACSSTPAEGYLMDANINGSSTFSECSKDAMLATMEYAACLVPIGDPDLTFISQPPQTTTPGSSLTWAITVQNIGTGPAIQPQLSITLPEGLNVASATIAGGSCLSSAQAIDCVFDGLDAHEARPVEMVMTGSTLGTYVVQAQASVTHDADISNDHVQFTMNVQDEAVQSPATTRGATSGGGSFGPLTLLALLATGLGRRASLQH